MWLFALFILLPLTEIGLFIQVGGWLGLWPSLAIVLGTAILGSYLIRQQGQAVVKELQTSVQRGGNPAAALAHGGLIVVAGFLLLAPGFLTDTLGLLLMIPPLRAAVIAAVSRRVKVQQMSFAAMHAQARRRDGEDVIEGEFIDLEDQQPGKPGNSDWTRH